MQTIGAPARLHRDTCQLDVGGDEPWIPLEHLLEHRARSLQIRRRHGFVDHPERRCEIPLIPGLEGRERGVLVSRTIDLGEQFLP